MRLGRSHRYCTASPSRWISSPLNL
jgi:hypothetical protein